MEHSCSQMDRISKLSEDSVLNAKEMKRMTNKMEQMDVKIDKIVDKIETFSLWLVNLQSYMEEKNRENEDKIRDWTTRNFAPMTVKTIVYSMVWLIIASFFWALIALVIK